MIEDGLIVFMLFFFILFFITTLAIYIYFSLALMKVARRLKTEPAWLAWIPIGNLYLTSKMAKMHWWPILLFLGVFIPYLGFLASIVLTAFGFIWVWKICERRKRPGWWALLLLIPIFNIVWGFIIWGILAWSKK